VKIGKGKMRFGKSLDSRGKETKPKSLAMKSTTIVQAIWPRERIFAEGNL
jgi:hypothetical protein